MSDAARQHRQRRAVPLLMTHENMLQAMAAWIARRISTSMAPILDSLGEPLRIDAVRRGILMAVNAGGSRRRPRP